MIRERFINLVICSTLLSLVTNYSSAIASNLSRHSQGELSIKLSQSDRFSTADERNKLNRKIRETTNSIPAELWLSQNSLQTEPQPSDNQNDSTLDEPSLQVNRRLFIIAMAVTSAISLLLLWLLFKKQPQQEISEELSAKDRHLQESAEDRTESEIAPSPVVGFKEYGTNSLENSQEPAVLGLADLVDREEGTIADRQLRRKIGELKIAGDARSIEPLIELMSRVDSSDRDLISNAIAQILYRSFKPVNDGLFDALQDKNSEVKKSAIRDLAVLYEFISPITKQLVQMQLDPDPEVSQTAIHASQQLNLSSSSQPSHHSGERINSLKKSHG